MARVVQAEGLFPTNHIEGQTNTLTALLDGYGALEHSLYDVPVYGDVAKRRAAARSSTTAGMSTSRWLEVPVAAAHHDAE
jgi:hypothetical protein